MVEYCKFWRWEAEPESGKFPMHRSGDDDDDEEEEEEEEDTWRV
jgi:hypothetical protein